MKNLFNFEYTEQELNNVDGTKSNFRQVFGKDGVNMVCPKGTYHIVKTEDVSTLGHAFIKKGFKVETFDHRSGESIGLNVSFGSYPSKVGQSQYNLIITVPNNGGGKGYLAIKQLRLICSNGMVSNKTLHKDNYIKIPHTVNYNESIKLMELSINGFASLMEQVESQDIFLEGKKLNTTDAMYQLNKWFFEQEFPSSQKDGMTLDNFRKALAVDPNSIKCIDRYNELMDAFQREIGYNKELSLELSMYTVYASVTNYLSRRVEKSNSKASNEVQVERASKKLTFFEMA